MSLMNDGSIEIWDITRLVPYEKNAKIHGDKQVESLADLIHRNGWTQPIVAQKSSGSMSSPNAATSNASGSCPAC